MNTTGGSAASAPPPPAPADPLSVLRGGSELRARVLSAVCLAPVVLWAMWRGGAALTALLAVVCAVGLGEWASMLLPGRRRVDIAAAALIGGGIMLLAMTSWPGWAAAALLPAAAMAAAADKDQRGLAALGAPYVIFGGLALWALAVGTEGRATLFFVVLLVWATDIGAYAAGRTIGGPKLAPRLSPKKTWAGLLGGMAAAGVVGFGVSAFVGGSVLLNGLLAAGLAVVAQAGDLFESWAKRRAGVKDSSRLIPGHGGVLDRIDGLLTAAIALALHQAVHGSIFAG
jgi:phosphatidate cytidylyltransferase